MKLAKLQAINKGLRAIHKGLRSIREESEEIEERVEKIEERVGAIGERGHSGLAEPEAMHEGLKAIHKRLKAIHKELEAIDEERGFEDLSPTEYEGLEAIQEGLELIQDEIDSELSLRHHARLKAIHEEFYAVQDEIDFCLNPPAWPIGKPTQAIHIAAPTPAPTPAGPPSLIGGNGVPRNYGRTGNDLIARRAAASAATQPRSRPAMPHPPVPPPPAGPPSLIDGNGVVHNYVPGLGFQPQTRFGVPIRDTTIAGTPRTEPTIGPPSPASFGPGGPRVTGTFGQPLYGRPPIRGPR